MSNLSGLLVYTEPLFHSVVESVPGERFEHLLSPGGERPEVSGPAHGASQTGRPRDGTRVYTPISDL